MVGLRANQKPTNTPAVAPIAKASIDSASVTHRCRQMVPLANSRTTRAATSPGVEKKNGGNTATPKYASVLRTCHSAITATATMACSRRSLARDNAALVHGGSPEPPGPALAGPMINSAKSEAALPQNENAEPRMEGPQSGALHPGYVYPLSTSALSTAQI